MFNEKQKPNLINRKISDFWNRKKKSKSSKNKTLLILNKLIMFFFILLFLPKNISNKVLISKRKLNLNSEIYLTVKKGSQQLISDYFLNTFPSEVLYKGKIITKDYWGYFDISEDEINNITLRWDELEIYCDSMFKNLNDILFINLSNYDLSQVKIMTNMFSGCTSLTSIDFGNIITKSLLEMDNMFLDCNSLKYLDLRVFDVSKISNMEGLFKGCHSLEFLNISSFITSSVENMNEMFMECKSLTSLDLNHFNTSLVDSMTSMFEDCQSLKILYIDKFVTKSVTHMERMFCQCSNLISLDLNNFDTSSVVSMESIFSNCDSLILLNIKNFNLPEEVNENFIDLQETKICINKDLLDYLNEHFVMQIIPIYNCSDDICFQDDKKIIIEKRKCVMSCNDDDYYKFEYNDFCYNSCPNGTSPTSDNKCILNDQYNINSQSSDSDLQSSISEISLIPSSEINKTINSYISSYDYSDSLYTIITNSSTLIINKSEITKTSIISDISERINTETSIIFADSSIDSHTFIKKSDNLDTNSGHDNNHDSYNINNLNYNLCIIDSNNSYDINEIIINIKNNSLICKLNLFNIFIIDQKDIYIKDNNKLYQITSSYNQYNNEYKNISIIKLGECEERLRKYYNIDDNEILIIFKIEIRDDNYLIPVIEYEVYNLNTEEKKLDLKLCEDIKIDIFIPVSIEENNIFKYNSSSDYYNDFCFPYTTINKTDIIIDDRRKEYINNNLSLCEKDCDLREYSFNNKKVKCECLTKTTLTPLNDNINSDNFFHNFINIKKNSNIEIIKCYKVLFTKDRIIKNIGNYIYIIIILIDIVLVILFKLKGYKKILNKMDNIIKIKKEEENNQIIKENNLIKIIKNNNKKTIFFKRKITKKKTFTINPITKINLKNINNPPKKESMEIFKRNIYLSKTNDKMKEQIYSKRDSSNFINLEKKQKNSISFFNNKPNISINEMYNYNDYELNSLNYDKAYEIDKRSYIQYYFSLLRTKHLLIFTFYTYTDYNSRIIKICLFLFSFALYYTVNALFFNDETMHKIYVDNGNFNILFQLPQIFYSLIISSIINVIIKYLSLSEKDIIDLKNEKMNIQTKKVETLKCLKIKFILFFIFNFLFLFFFWYYLSCFCAVYINTQIHLITDTLISFGLALMYPLGIYLMPGIFRLAALSSKSKEGKCLYILSKIIQLV